MITCEQIPISEASAADLREMLDSVPMGTLHKVIIDLRKKVECEALAKAGDSKDYPLMIEAAKDILEKAQRYAIATEVLIEVQNLKQFNTVKLS